VKTLPWSLWWGRVAALWILLAIMPVHAATPAAADPGADESAQLLNPDNELRLGEPPDPSGPTPVHVGLFVSDLRDIDALSSSYHLRGVLSISWTDPRLAFDPAVEGVAEKIYFGQDADRLAQQIWTARGFPANQLEEVKITERVYSIGADGTVRGDSNVSLRLAANYDLRRFPFDQQTLVLEIESFAWNDSQVVFVADAGATGFDVEFDTPEWQITNVSASEESVPVVRSSKPFSRLTLAIDIERKVGFYLWKILLPLLIIVALSWSVFWMVEDKFGVRVRASATGVLTIVAFQFVASQNLPRIGYLTLMDKIMVISFLLLTTTVLQSYIVSRYQDGNPAKALLIDRHSRWIFPLSYLGLLAWVALSS
jgi:hypothetical protein